MAAPRFASSSRMHRRPMVVFAWACLMLLWLRPAAAADGVSPSIPPGREPVVEALVAPFWDHPPAGMVVEGARIERTVVEIRLRAADREALVILRHPSAVPSDLAPDARAGGAEIGLVMELQCPDCSEGSWRLVRQLAAHIEERARATAPELWLGPVEKVPERRSAGPFVPLGLLVLGLAASLALPRVGSEAWRTLRAGERPAYWAAAVLGALVFVGVLLRAWHATSILPTANELWLSYHDTLLGFLQSPEVTFNPPLFPALVWPLGGPTDVLGYRWGAVILSGGGILLGALAGRILLGRGAGLLVAAVLALHPSAVWLGFQNRSYALAVPVVLLALVATWLALERPDWKNRWAAAVALALLPWTHYAVGFLAVGIGLWVLFDPRRGSLRLWLGPAAAALALTAPLVVAALQGAEVKQMTEAATGGAAAVGKLWTDAAAMLVGAQRSRLLYGNHETWLILPFQVALALCLAAAAWGTWARARWAVVLSGAVGLVAPLALGGLIGTMRSSHFAGVLPLVALGYAALILGPWRLAARRGFAAAVGVAGSMVVAAFVLGFFGLTLCGAARDFAPGVWPATLASLDGETAVLAPSEPVATVLRTLPVDEPSSPTERTVVAVESCTPAALDAVPDGIEQVAFLSVQYWHYEPCRPSDFGLSEAACTRVADGGAFVCPLRPEGRP